jgi:hypothetical protein
MAGGEGGGEWKKVIPRIPAATWVASGERPSACTTMVSTRIDVVVPQGEDTEEVGVEM